MAQRVDLEAMTDEEVEAEITALDRARPTDHQLAGGAPRSFAWLLTIVGIVGAIASIELVVSEIQLAADPNAALTCDINPFIACGTFLQTWQGHVFFGLPNALLGAVGFGALTGVGATMLAGARYARWFWLALLGGVLGAGLFVLWFMGVSFFVVKALCPWCFVVWVSTIPLVTHTLARTVQGRHFSFGSRVDGVLVRERHLVTAALYILLLLAIAIAYWDSWLTLLIGAF